MYVSVCSVPYHLPRWHFLSYQEQPTSMIIKWTPSVPSHYQSCAWRCESTKSRALRRTRRSNQFQEVDVKSRMNVLHGCLAVLKNSGDGVITFDLLVEWYTTHCGSCGWMREMVVEAETVRVIVTTTAAMNDVRLPQICQGDLMLPVQGETAGMFRRNYPYKLERGEQQTTMNYGSLTQIDINHWTWYQSRWKDRAQLIHGSQTIKSWFLCQ